MRFWLGFVVVAITLVAIAFVPSGLTESGASEQLLVNSSVLVPSPPTDAQPISVTDAPPVTELFLTKRATAVPTRSSTTHSSPSTVAMQCGDCYTASCLDSAAFVNCLRASVQPVTVTFETVRTGTRQVHKDTAAAWAKRGGIGRRELFNASGWEPTFFVSPPSMELLSSGILQPKSSSWLLAQDVVALVASPDFVTSWNKRAESIAAKRGVARSEIEGFLLVLAFGDHPREDWGHSGLAIYGGGAYPSPFFVVFDPFMSAKEVHLGSYHNTRYTALVAHILNVSFDAVGPLLLKDPQPQPVASTWLPWSKRLNMTHFSGGPTSPVRRNVAAALGLDKKRGMRANVTQLQKLRARSDFAVGFAYGRRKTTRMQGWDTLFQYKALWSIRGVSASLRDRLLLLSGAAIFGVRSTSSSPSPEPWQLYHRIMTPFVHYVPIPYVQRGPRLRPHETALWRDDMRLLKLVDALLSQCDSELHEIAQNAYRLGMVIAHRPTRDEALLSGIESFLDASAWEADAGLPLTLADAQLMVKEAELAASPFWPPHLRPSARRR